MVVRVAVLLITAAVPGPTVFLEQWGCVVDDVGSSDAILFDEQEEEWEGSSDANLCEGLATEFREGCELSLNLLWANIKLPASLAMNMEAHKSEQLLGRLRGFCVRGPRWRDHSQLVLSHIACVLCVLPFAIDACEHHVHACVCMPAWEHMFPACVLMHSLGSNT